MPEARLVTAVALYGPKTGEFRRLLKTVQGICRQRLGDAFRPYTLEQIHGTVIRLDGLPGPAGAGPAGAAPVNQRWLEHTGTARAMDLPRALDILAAGFTPPVRVQVGGFRPGAPAAFASRGQTPYERMFSAQGDALVLVGWPVSTVAHGLSRRPLDELRHRMAQAGVWHWYHDSPQDVDNDLHLVIGHCAGAPAREGAPAGDLAGTAGAVRDYLAGHPAEVDVGADQITIIASDSPTLAPATFAARLPADPAAVEGLYRPSRRAARLRRYRC
ncbi:MAG TPA: hypothetical protein VGH27_08570 [Streptosporangiaceae bacterium]|jgi:hypothetical protein